MPVEAVLEARNRYLARALAEDAAVAERLAATYQGTLARMRDVLARVNRDLRELRAANEWTPAAAQRLRSYADLIEVMRRELNQFSVAAGRQTQLLIDWQGEAAVEGQHAMIEAQSPELRALLAQPDLRTVAELDRILVRAQQEGGALADLGARTAAQVGEDVLTLIAQGQSPAFIARYLRRAASLPYARAMTFVRTASAYAANEATAADQAANARLLQGWMWSAAKDTRTCAACLARDGEIFPVGQVLNDHHAGRCVSIPVTRGADWVGQYERGRDWYAGLPGADQARLVGRGTRDLLASGGTSWEAIPQDYHNPTMGLMSRRRPLYALQQIGAAARWLTTPRAAGNG